MHPRDRTLEEILGYQFADRSFLDRALTHRSWLAEQGKTSRGDNEQFEFLGDSVLGFLASEALFAAYPGSSEGQLSQARAQLVCANHLHACASAIGLGEFLHLGRGEERNGGRQRRTLLANALEAVIAAIFLDGGLEPAKIFVQKHILGAMTSAEPVALSLLDRKGVLQEQAQSRGLPTPRYAVVATHGPEHAKTFTVEVRIGSHFAQRAHGTSKKAASQQAASLLIDALSHSGWKISNDTPAHVSAGE